MLCRTVRTLCQIVMLSDVQYAATGVPQSLTGLLSKLSYDVVTAICTAESRES